MDCFVSKLDDFRSFTKSYRYKSYHMLYERFLEDDNSFKLDIWFGNSGNVQIHFWNPNKQNDIESHLSSVKNKLESIGYLDELTESKDGWIGYCKRFEFTKFQSMKLMDEHLLDFIKKFMRALNRDK